ncbi:MAG: prepilin-type N-terminal cleavage/methylation domain-containing protein [Nitrospirae bacterium]|nr:prepilin-type N-terminal cleavage/methylation domain-containing protein [Nitrospirota bacterium]
MKNKFNFFIFQFSFCIGAKRQKGFTLLEIMIALAILSLSLIALLSLRNSSIRLVEHSDRITTATLLAKAKMEEMPRSLQIGEAEGGFDGDEFKGYKWKRSVRTTPFAFIKEVVVVVMWDEGKGDVRLVAYE